MNSKLLILCIDHSRMPWMKWNFHSTIWLSKCLQMRMPKRIWYFVCANVYVSSQYAQFHIYHHYRINLSKWEHNGNDRGCESLTKGNTAYWTATTKKKNNIKYMKLIDKLFILAINDKITYASALITFQQNSGIISIKWREKKKGKNCAPSINCSFKMQTI